MAELARTCEVCGGAMRRLKDWLFRCPACGFLASTLTPGPGTGIEGLEQLRRENFELLIDHLDRLGGLDGKRLLEVGSAWGWFLEAASRRGALVRGIEPEVANAELSRSKGFEVEVGLFPGDLVDKGPYDIIIFNDVLEHIPQPGHVMRAVANLLSPGGIAVVNLPSSKGMLYRIARLMDRIGLSGPYDRLWQKGFPSPHISYFNPANLCRLVEQDAHLVQVATYSLPSLSRTDLWPRIRSSHSGMAGFAMFAGVWLLSFVVDSLPADIHVAVFRKPTSSSGQAA